MKERRLRYNETKKNSNRNFANFSSLIRKWNKSHRKKSRRPAETRKDLPSTRSTQHKPPNTTENKEVKSRRGNVKNRDPIITSSRNLAEMKIKIAVIHFCITAQSFYTKLNFKLTKTKFLYKTVFPAD